MTRKVEADAANYLVNRQSEGQLANGTAKGTLSRNQQQGQGGKVQVAPNINGNPAPYAGVVHSQLCRSCGLSLPTGR